MAIPEKREDLVAGGYVFDNDGFCKGCGAPIEWWITPRDKKMPMALKEVRADQKNPVSPIVEILRIPHFVDCPDAAQFRRKK